jgi:hypothetical protein
MATYYIIGKICSTANGYTLGTISRYDYHVEIAHCISEANVEYPFFIKHTTEDHLPNISDIVSFKSTITGLYIIKKKNDNNLYIASVSNYKFYIDSRTIWHFGRYKNTDFQNILSNQEMGITSNESITDDDIEEKLQSSIGTLSDDHTILVKNNIIVINYSADNPGVFRIVFNLLNTLNKSNNILDLYSFGDGNVQGVLSNYTNAIKGFEAYIEKVHKNIFIKCNISGAYLFNCTLKYNIATYKFTNSLPEGLEKIPISFLGNIANNSGKTEDRPTNADKGFQYYDTDINKPIWWNGSSWTDASGSTV